MVVVVLFALVFEANRPIAEVAAANETTLFEGCQPSVHGDEIAFFVFQALVDLFRSERTVVLDEELQQCHPRPSDLKSAFSQLILRLELVLSRVIHECAHNTKLSKKKPPPQKRMPRQKVQKVRHHFCENSAGSFLLRLSAR